MQIFADHLPTAMLFIPSIAGISHSFGAPPVAYPPPPPAHTPSCAPPELPHAAFHCHDRDHDRGHWQ